VASEGAARGATFTVEIPIEPPPESPAPTGTALQSAPVLRGVRVLLVDDDDDARDLLTAVLERAGAQILTAASVAEALELVEREGPDVIVSDVGMPYRDGYALLEELRSRDWRLPAVALTAYARPEDRSRALGPASRRIWPSPPSRRSWRTSSRRW